MARTEPKLLIVTLHGTRIRSLSSRWLLLGLGGLVGAGLLVIGGKVVPDRLPPLMEVSQYRQLNNQQKQLQQQLRQLQKVNQTLQGDLHHLIGLEDKVRVTLGLQGLPVEIDATDANPKRLSPHTIVSAWPALNPVNEQVIRNQIDALLKQAKQLHATLASIDVESPQARKKWASTPTIQPVAGAVTAFFGIRQDPFTGWQLPHNGLDFTAAQGSPVVATAAGRVVRTAFDRNYGRLVEINHGYGLITRYTHLLRIHVRRGQRVKRGQIIGRVGQSGLVTGYQVHYEINHAGTKVDPMIYLFPQPNCELTATLADRLFGE